MAKLWESFDGKLLILVFVLRVGKERNKRNLMYFGETSFVVIIEYISRKID